MKKWQRRRITKKKKNVNGDNLDIKYHAKDIVPSYLVLWRKKKKKWDYLYSAEFNLFQTFKGCEYYYL